MHQHILQLAHRYAKNYAGLPTEAWFRILLNLFNSIAIGGFYFLSIYFVIDLHFNIAIAGNIISCYGIGAMIGSVLSGKLSDRSSPRFVSVMSLLIQGFGYLALIKLHNPYFLMLNLFILGSASYGFLTSNTLFLLQQCHLEETQRLKAINLLSTASNLGLGISAVIIGQISHFGFYTIFLMSGITLFILAFSAFMQFSHSFFQKTMPVAQKKNDVKKSFVTPCILVSVFFVGAIVAQQSCTYPLYIKQLFPQFGLHAVSILFLLNSMLVVLFEVPLGHFINPYNKIVMVGIGAFLIGFGMLLLSISSLFILAIGSCVIYTIGEMIFFSTAQLVCYQAGKENKKGHSLGSFRMIFASSRVLGPSIGGFIYSHFGSNLIWYISGFIGVQCLIGSLYLKKYN